MSEQVNQTMNNISVFEEEEFKSLPLDDFKAVYKQRLTSKEINRIGAFINDFTTILSEHIQYIKHNLVKLDISDLDSSKACVSELIKNPLQYMEVINRLTQEAKGTNSQKVFVELIGCEDIEEIGTHTAQDNLGGLIHLKDSYMEYVGNERSNPIKQAFICQNRHKTYRKFERGEEIEKPLNCSNEKCNLNPYKEVSSGQNIGNGQKVTCAKNHAIQIKQVVLKNDSERILGEIDKAIFDKAERGKEYDITAILRKSKNEETRAEKYYLHIVGLDEKDKQADISEQQKERVNEYVTETTLKERVFDIDTYTDKRYYPRLSVLLSVVKGKEEDGINSNIHTLLIGETGLGKSELCGKAVELAEKGGKVDMQKASKAGLVGSAEKMALMGEGQTWVLSHGELARKSGGAVLIDEMDKVNSPDMVNILSETMENQETTKTKAGKSKTLETDLSILGTANPISGYRAIEKNGKKDAIGDEIQKHIMNRFDLIIWFSEEEEEKTQEDEKEEVLGLLDTDKTRPEIYPQYIQMARNIQPRIEKQGKAISDLVKHIRQAKSKGNSNRIRETLINISVGIAKLRLHDKVTTEDVEDAWDIFKHSQEEIYDIDY
jgi:DNA replicative helicase MCM subunit Mcm2 (Cdc46/Mcm family)